MIKCAFLIFLAIGSAQDSALRHFVRNKKVYNSSVTILGGLQKWIEHKYYFDESKAVARANDQTVTVAIYQSHRLYFDGSYKLEGKNVTATFGYSFEILKTLQEILNFNARFIHFAFQKNVTGKIEELLLTGEIDFVLGHLLQFNHTNVTIMHRTITSGYVFVYKRRKVQSTKDIFILTFAGWLWFCFLLLLVLLAICLRISTRSYSQTVMVRKAWTWVEITLWAIAATCQQGLSYEPNGFVSCTIFILGYLLAYLLYTGFTAAITSVLIENDLNHEDMIRDIGKYTIVCLEYLRNDLICTSQYKNAVFVNDFEELFVELNQNDVVGFVPKIFVDQYFAANFDYNTVKTYLVTATSYSFVSGFAIALNNTWRKPLNTELVRLQQSGVLKNLLQRSLLQVPVKRSTISYSRAGKEHIGSALFLLLAGIVAALLFLLIEFAYKYFKKSTRNK